jgi:hypothetical protein
MSMSMNLPPAFPMFGIKVAKHAKPAKKAKSTQTPTDNGKPVAELTDKRLDAIALFGEEFGVNPELITAVTAERKRRGLEW